MAASRSDEKARAIFKARAELLHHDFSRDSGWMDIRTTAVLLTPADHARRDWDTTMLSIIGDLNLDPEYVAFIRDQLDRTRTDGR